MKVEIINIGDELLIGQVVNTNASWMAEQFKLSGIEIVQITAISDTYEHIFSAIDSAKTRADAIVMTGGLGPTRDDITKDALCKYFNTTLKFNVEAYQQVEALFKLRGFKVSEINRRQAELPANCIPLKNPHGTAACMWLQQEGKIIVSIAGVPFVMKSLVTDEIIPRLLKKFKAESILSKTVLTQGIGESALAEIIEDWEKALPANFKLAYLPQPGIVRLRLTVKGKQEEGLQQKLDGQLLKLQQIIPSLIFGYDEDSLEKVLLELLLKNHKTVSFAESCTGGYLSHLLTSVPGSSKSFMGSVVAYDNKVKENMLGVSVDSLIKYGAVSEQVAKEMAIGVQEVLRTD